MGEKKPMDEAAWQACADPGPMLAFLRGRASDRKLRLFACACCRRIWRLVSDQRSRFAIKILGRFVEGKASQAELRQAHDSASDALEAIHADANEQRWYYAEESAARAVYEACRSDFREGCALEVALRVSDAIVFAEDRVAGNLRRRVRSAQAACIREIIGNPFRPVRINPSRMTRDEGAVAKLARDIYRARTFDVLPVLADALEDAGCTDADILAHLRGPGPHVRGCWVLDLILGRE
jgi:hypothetical protein